MHPLHCHTISGPVLVLHHMDSRGPSNSQGHYLQGIGFNVTVIGNKFSLHLPILLSNLKYFSFKYPC